MTKNGWKGAAALAYKLTGNYDNCPQYLKDGLDSTCKLVKTAGEHALAWGVGLGSDYFGVKGAKSGYLGYLNNLYQSDKKAAWDTTVAVKNGIVTSAKSIYNDFASGNAYKIGEHLFDVASFVAPWTKAGKAFELMNSVGGMAKMATLGKVDLSVGKMMGYAGKGFKAANTGISATGQGIKAAAKPIASGSGKGFKAAKTELCAVGRDVRNTFTKNAIKSDCNFSDKIVVRKVQGEDSKKLLDVDESGKLLWSDNYPTDHNLNVSINSSEHADYFKNNR